MLKLVLDLLILCFICYFYVNMQHSKRALLSEIAGLKKEIEALGKGHPR